MSISEQLWAHHQLSFSSFLFHFHARPFPRPHGPQTRSQQPMPAQYTPNHLYALPQTPIYLKSTFSHPSHNPSTSSALSHITYPIHHPPPPKQSHPPIPPHPPTPNPPHAFPELPNISIHSSTASCITLVPLSITSLTPLFPPSLCTSKYLPFNTPLIFTFDIPFCTHFS